MLGALLGVAAQLVGQAVVVGGGGAARAGAGDRVRLHAVAHHLDEELRAGPDDLEARGACEEQVRRGVHAAQSAVQADPVDGPAAGSGWQLE